VVAAGLALVLAGCVGLHSGPRTLAGVGAMVVATGSANWAAGEVTDPSGQSTTSRVLIDGGFIAVVVGLAAVVVAGGWMAASVSCHADPDCADEEQCRDVPAPPGGIPYKQCVPR
jgi:hypothetical protein